VLTLPVKHKVPEEIRKWRKVCFKIQTPGKAYEIRRKPGESIVEES
jgi:hypothetical protein